MRTVFACIFPILFFLAACSLSLPSEPVPNEQGLAQPRLFGQVELNTIQLYWGYLDLRVPGNNLVAPEAFEIWMQETNKEEGTLIEVVNGDVFSWSNEMETSATQIWEVRAVGEGGNRKQSNQIMLQAGASPRYLPVSNESSRLRHQGIWSQDGRQLTFAQRPDSSSEWMLWQQDLFSRNSMELVPGTEPDLHPVNNSLVFVQLEPAVADKAEGRSRLGISATGEISFLSLPTGHFRQPRWSPDGQQLLFWGRIEAQTEQNLYLLPIQSLVNPEPIYFGIEIPEDLPVVLPSGPLDASWGADAEQIYFAQYQSKEGGFARDIFQGIVSAGVAEPVISSPWQDFSPSLSPDGQWLAFVSDRSGLPAIWLQQQDTGALLQLTGQSASPLPVADTRLAWSPNSNEILFTGRIAGERPTLYRAILAY